MDRRTFISLSSVAAAGGAMTALGSPAVAGEAVAATRKPGHRSSRPNVVLMICDDLGFGDLACYGSRLPTPNLDSIAAEGMRFTHYNSGHPICSASRAALLSGRYGHRSETRGAFGPQELKGMSLDETLLSNLFHARGYKTKAIGKWHLGSTPEYLPTNRGFDSFYGVPYSIDMKPFPLLRDTTVLEPETDRDLLTPRYTQEAVEYIAQAGQEPFFLYMAFSYPHNPARGSARFHGKTGFGDFGDAVAEIDWSVGQVMHALEQKGLTENTLTMFTSDHGPWYQGNPGALRGRKASTFEGGFRVPFVARWKGTISAGRVENAWCSSLDVLPTLRALCGLDAPAKPLDGDSFAGILTGRETTTAERSRLYFYPQGERGLDVHCIRKGDWKLRVAQGTAGGGMYINDQGSRAEGSAWLQHPELYNLSTDPEESYDVAALNPEIVKKLSEELETEMQTFPAPVVEAYKNLQLKKDDISTPPGASPRANREAKPAAT